MGQLTAPALVSMQRRLFLPDFPTGFAECSHRAFPAGPKFSASWLACSSDTVSHVQGHNSPCHRQDQPQGDPAVLGGADLRPHLGVPAEDAVDPGQVPGHISAGRRRPGCSHRFSHCAGPFLHVLPPAGGVPSPPTPPPTRQSQNTPPVITKRSAGPPAWQNPPARPPGPSDTGSKNLMSSLSWINPVRLMGCHSFPSRVMDCFIIASFPKKDKPFFPPSQAGTPSRPMDNLKKGVRLQIAEIIPCHFYNSRKNLFFSRHFSPFPFRFFCL